MGKMKEIKVEALYDFMSRERVGLKDPSRLVIYLVPAPSKAKTMNLRCKIETKAEIKKAKSKSMSQVKTEAEAKEAAILAQLVEEKELPDELFVLQVPAEYTHE